MYKFRIIYPGRTKAKFIKEGIEHYIKLLSPYAKVELIELREGQGNKDRIIYEESKQILNSVKERFILLHIQGQLLDSLEFANLIRDRALHEFVIGGVYGVSDKVVDSAFFKLSLSPLTFTHELSRLVLFEQLYRAITIIYGKSYHY
ncbi:23S rRNA (pseudouridine1915-N3)-methyltransferase [Thermodesulfovibrio aggregans]|uniref:Ribosomal RNA large subunit methyltransferase H n=1 Tax=Thermodesulfovibrio aggregans TaxID=86166 RepID=A0A0U9HXM2_9BACT|nr:23S rRNA (pseudouridine(1915)-N(3))-methyltransferase RlmH [Thermodesulfovibrio aggregans]GAQ94485.1 23S rRNA (pseudouridine1915-N3)-methyltransferase [Thermodesulfovibrio aggregans]